MKKWGLLLGCLLSGMAYAQNVHWGIKGGSNIANFRADFPNQKSLMGYYAGGLLEYRLNDKWAIQPEILYSLQGNTYAVTWNPTPTGAMSVSYEQTNQLHYINLPVLAKYALLPKWKLEAGVLWGYQVNGETEVTVTDATGSHTYTSNPPVLFQSYHLGMIEEPHTLSNERRRSDWAWVVGSSYAFHSGVFVQVRYQYGLQTMEKNDLQDVEVYNNVWQIGLGYTF